MTIWTPLARRLARMAAGLSLVISMVLLGAASARASVTITSPTNSQVLGNVTSVTIRGTAITAPANGRSVRLFTSVDGDDQFCGGILAGTVNFGCLRGVSVGTHTARARIRIADPNGAVSEQLSNTVTFTVARLQDVNVAISSPANNSVVSSPFNLTASANTNALGGLQGGERLRLVATLDSDVVATTERTTPGATSVGLQQPLTACRGVHVVGVTGTFLKGDQSTATAQATSTFTVNLPPTLAIQDLLPANGTQAQGDNKVTLSATAVTNCLAPGDRMTLVLFLDGVRVGAGSLGASNAGKLTVSQQLIAEGGSHTLRADATVMLANGTTLRQSQASTFSVVQSPPTLLVFGNGPTDFPFNVSTILRYDGQAGAFGGYFVGQPDLSPPNLVLNPCAPLDMTYGPDGQLYVLDAPHPRDYCSNANTVSRFNGQTGAFDQIEDEHADYIRRGALLTFYGGFTFGPDGDLYISNDGNIQRFQGPFAPAPGAFIDIFASSPLLRTSTPGHLRFGPDGNLYVIARQPDAVLKIDSATRTVQEYVIPGNLNSPTDLRYGPDGDLYVLNSGSATMQRYAGPARSNPGSLLSQFRVAAFPQSFTFGPDDDLFVTGGGSASQAFGVYRYTAAGGFIGQFATVKGGSGMATLFSSIPLAVQVLGDFNHDGCVDRTDLNLLLEDVRSSGPHDPAHDLNGDGSVTIADSRKLILLFSRPGGAACN